MSLPRPMPATDYAGNPRPTRTPFWVQLWDNGDWTFTCPEHPNRSTNPFEPEPGMLAEYDDTGDLVWTAPGLKLHHLNVPQTLIP